MENLTNEKLDIEDVITRLIEKIQITPNRETPLDEQAKFYESLRELKDFLETGKKAVNIALRETEKSFAFAIAERDEDVSFETATATLTVSAEGYYSVKDAEGFLKHLDNDLSRFVELTSKKSALKKYCADILESGFDLPDCIKYTIVPAIRMRKK